MNKDETIEDTGTGAGANPMKHLINKPVLLHGDCLQLMGTLEAGSVDLVLPDPPFTCC